VRKVCVKKIKNKKQSAQRASIKRAQKKKRDDETFASRRNGKYVNYV